uniref:Carbamoyltransferase n=1 Tax=Streptomyces sp. NBC_00003 TaxID=2903608 RepID=A0AAU2UVY7_9ACTN
MAHLVLGISAYFHDSAAALVEGGVPVAAVQEERFTRRRQDPSFPAHAVSYCMHQAGVRFEDLDAIAYYEDPRLKFRRLLATFLGTAPKGLRSFRAAAPQWLTWKRRTLDVVRERLSGLGLGTAPEIIPVRHHRSHAASAFYPSPYGSAAVLCVDGVGEWATTTMWHGQDTGLRQLAELRFPHSLGLFYSAFTHFCGFKVDSGEYKLMGLAPYGEPRFEGLIRDHLIDLRADGSFALDMRFFDYLSGNAMTGTAFERLFDGPRRQPEQELTTREFDLAASAQKVLEDAVLRLAGTAKARTGESRLCLAGGVALNCVANGAISRSGLFDEIWVQPAAGDAGGALGAALGVAMAADQPRTHVDTKTDAMSGALLGPAHSAEDVRELLETAKLPHRWLDSAELLKEVAAEIAAGKIVGWFQGRAEFGPRSLGNRSILGDPRDPDMQSTMNLKIKFRESFRPFAPSVLAEDAHEYFALTQQSPYMLMVAPLSGSQRLDEPVPPGLCGLDLLRVHRSRLPAVTHVDMTARVQTVERDTNPRYHGLLTAFKELTGCPVLVNTSFNVRGEPIVNTPTEAYTCFMRTGLDLLVMDNAVLRKDEQPAPPEDENWRQRIPLD